MDAINQRFKQVCGNMDLSQRNISSMTGISTRTISAVMTGEVLPSTDVLKKFASRFGVNLNYIILGVGKWLRETEEMKVPSGDNSINTVGDNNTSLQVNDTTIFDLSTNKSVNNTYARDTTIDRLSSIIEQQQATISSLQSSINQLSDANKILVDRLIKVYSQSLNQ